MLLLRCIFLPPTPTQKTRGPLPSPRPRLSARRTTSVNEVQRVAANSTHTPPCLPIENRAQQYRHDMSISLFAPFLCPTLTKAGDTQVGSGTHRTRHSRPRALGEFAKDPYICFTPMTSQNKIGKTRRTHPHPHHHPHSQTNKQTNERNVRTRAREVRGENEGKGRKKKRADL